MFQFSLSLISFSHYVHPSLSIPLASWRTRVAFWDSSSFEDISNNRLLIPCWTAFITAGEYIFTTRKAQGLFCPTNCFMARDHHIHQGLCLLIGSVNHVRDRTRNRYTQFHVTSSKRSVIKERCGNTLQRYTQSKLRLLSCVVHINHFWVHHLQKSRDILTDPIA